MTNYVVYMTTDITLSIHFSANNTPTRPLPESSPFQKNLLQEFLLAIFRADSPLHLNSCTQQIFVNLLDTISTTSLQLIVSTFRVEIETSLFNTASGFFTLTKHNGYHFQIL